MSSGWGSPEGGVGCGLLAERVGCEKLGAAVGALVGAGWDVLGDGAGWDVLGDGAGWDVLGAGAGVAGSDGPGIGEAVGVGAGAGAVRTSASSWRPTMPRKS